MNKQGLTQALFNLQVIITDQICQKRSEERGTPWELLSGEGARIERGDQLRDASGRSWKTELQGKVF